MATPLRDRDFAHTLALTGADPAWEGETVAATDPLAEAPYRGFVRLGEGSSARYAFFGGRTSWMQDGVPASEGLLYEVSGTLTKTPTGLPANGRVFREVCEAIVAGDPRLLPSLRAAYGR